MEKCSLDVHLFQNCIVAHALPWNIRRKNLIGAAHGLAFLHSLDKRNIVRALGASRSQNILVDESYNAKLCAFGFARYGPSATESETHVTAEVMGTRGCAVPEYLATG